MKNLSIAKKLYLAFGAVIILTIIVAGVSIFRLNHISSTFEVLQTKYFKIADAAMETQIHLLTARRHEKDFLARKDPKYLGRMTETIDHMQGEIDELTTTATHLGLTEISSEGGVVTDAKNSYKKAFDHVADLVKAQGDSKTGIRGQLRKHAHDTEEGIKKAGSADMMVDYLLMRRHEKDFILREDEKYVKKAQAVLNALKNKTSNGAYALHADQIMAGANAYLVAFEEFAKNIAQMKQEYPVMRKASHDIEELLEDIEIKVMKIVETQQNGAMDEKKATILFLYVFGGVIVLIGLFLAFFSVRSITKPLNLVIDGLDAGANQVSSASNQVSSSSQALAEGSSQQAASIEETSASMEEMSSMTSKNSENASHADNLMQDASTIVVTANTSMGKLIQSMDEISQASEKTSKIIKTIDEIAFQTNLLALNAAVEAARAGEAGAGFAVVADEVRNLAMRAADAAKDTAEMIEGTVKKVNEGSELVAQTNEAFGQVSESAEKVGSLVSEISEASKEQSGGIEQVNTAISEMDKVVQQNAANAEESASASEEMNAQAVQLKDYVGELVTLVTGHDNKESDQANRTITRTVRSSALPLVDQPTKKLSQNSQEVRPEQVIPFDDDDDFKDF